VWTHYGATPRARFGAALAGVGDLDRDGLDDVVVGAPDDFRTWFYEGTVAMFRGQANGGLSATPDWEQVGQRESAQLGSAVAAAGDVNHDGSPEFVYSALGWPSCDAVRGVAWLQFGKAPISVRPDTVRVMRAVGEEPFPWADPGLTNLAEIFAAADSNKLAVVLAELREVLDSRVLNTELEEEALLRLAPIAAAAPTNLWNEHFGDLVFDTGSAWWVDCGATNEYYDALGRLWTPDARFLVDASAPLAVVPQTVDDTLLTDRHLPNEMLRSERWFSSNLRYAVPVRPGRYRVVLYFAETCLPCVSPALGGTGCSACSRVFDVEYAGIRTNGINPADRALGAPLDGVGITLKATEIISAPFEIDDGVFNLTLYDRGSGNPPENPSIKGFALLRVPQPGKAFNRPHLSVTHSIRGAVTNLTLTTDLKGNLALVQSGFGTVRLQMSDDLITWRPANAPAVLLAGEVRFTVPRPTNPQFFRAALDLPGL
jgi:Malectin domain/FG-GAP-like repeat